MVNIVESPLFCLCGFNSHDTGILDDENRELSEMSIARVNAASRFSSCSAPAQDLLKPPFWRNNHFNYGLHVFLMYRGVSFSQKIESANPD